MSKTCTAICTLMVELCSCLFFSPLACKFHKLCTSVLVFTLRTFCKLTRCSATAWSRMCTHFWSLALSSGFFPLFLVSISATSLCALHYHNGQVEPPLEALLGSLWRWIQESLHGRVGTRGPCLGMFRLGARNLVPGRGITRTYPLKRPSPA